MAESVIELVAGTGKIIGQDIFETINQSLHEGSPELAQMEQQSTQARTPVLTGALQSDVVGIEQTDPSNLELALINAANKGQLDEWGRVYDIYVEGGELGAPSPTIHSPAEMFGKILTDDIAQIEQWAKDWSDKALDLCALGKGVPL